MACWAIPQTDAVASSKPLMLTAGAAVAAGSTDWPLVAQPEIARRVLVTTATVVIARMSRRLPAIGRADGVAPARV
ncbi:hypothetical protein Aph02nite_89600 [Actinoplanes philippinensis]|nr:hypothetical protein Aph02nite_89600 [Actinoplanes philippinensis]